MYDSISAAASAAATAATQPAFPTAWPELPLGSRTRWGDADQGLTNLFFSLRPTLGS